MVRGLVVMCAVATVAGTAALASPARPRPAASVSCGEISDGGAVWAPGGGFVAFTRARASGAVSQVFRLGVDGRHLRLLSRPGEYAYGVAWSADGSRIAYNTFDLAAVVRVVVARFDGTQGHVVATFQDEREPPPTFLSWSPNGKELAYVASSGELAAVEVDGSGTRMIARGATQPAWSPDGRRVTYVAARGIVVADVSGSDARIIADGAFPTWSPDGRLIAYQSRSGVGVHVIQADGGGDRIVDARGSFPAWSSDGRRLVVVTESTGRVRAALHVVDLQRRRVATVSHDSSLRFGSDDFGASFSPAGKTILFTSAPTGVPTLGGTELRFVGSDGHRERRLTYHCAVADESLGARIYGTWLDDRVLASNGLRDTVVCGRGRDVVFADRVDRVAKDCESVRRGR